MKLYQLIDQKMVTECLSDIALTKLQTDSNNFGGVMFERDLAKKLRQKGFYVWTQREVETLIDNGQIFDFGCNLAEFKRRQKNIDDVVYASDLFWFDYDNGLFRLIDSLSVKTSINDNDSSKVFIANDAEGIVYDRLQSNEDNFTIGQVLMVSMNTDNLTFSVDYFDSTIQDLVSVFQESEDKGDKMVYRAPGKRSLVDTLSIMNRNVKTNKKQTSFNRGVQIRRDFIPTLSTYGVFTNLCKGSVKVDTYKLVGELLTLN